MRRVVSPPTVLLFLLLLPGAAIAFPGRCDYWTEVDTDRFRLVTSLAPAKALRIAEQLNHFEAAIETVTDARDLDPAVPTTVYVLGYRDWSYLPLHSALNSSSSHDRFENRIFVLADPEHGRLPFGPVMHEYVHYVLANQGGTRYPKWYDEGLAEILSVSVEDRESFRIGMLSRGSKPYYKWVPYETLFNTELSDRALPRGMDIESYNLEVALLVHYLTFGSPERKRQLADYFVARNRDVPPAKAFSDSFHASYEQLEIETAKYSGRNLFDSYRLLKSTLKSRRGPVSSHIPCARARVETGFALLAEHADPAAIEENWFTASDENGAADWRLGRTAVALARKDFVMANQYINHAIAGQGVNGAAMLRAAELLLAQVPDVERETATLSSADRAIVERAAALLENSQVTATGSLRATYWRSVTSLRTGQGLDGALDVAIDALKRFPKNAAVADVAARLCERLGDMESAAGAWSIVANYSPDGSKREAARKRLGEIDAAR